MGNHATFPHVAENVLHTSGFCLHDEQLSFLTVQDCLRCLELNEP